MKRIDRETTQRILDAADIVEVVSDFVSLKKRGANYIGLCPFHNERTPSFSVSRAKGICKCFSCGKGGSPVNFIMEHEQLSYYEALKYLAHKYHIEIKEHEMTDQEREEASERESLMALNDFALHHFCYNLADTADGRDIGLAYFRERGINDQMVAKFKLGYSLDRSDALYKAAIAKGFTQKALVDTGLCALSERDQRVYDRFRGRVIYPVFSVSGRVIAFGGRTLRSDKSMAKYVNSPESLIYHKSRELYGLYQAKSAIAKMDKCILVEGYMDVISMHQVGVCNVVASSGTSLTEGQIRLIHRFTQNVTVIYDSDPAGIKASLRGIDLLLAEGLNVKVLLLPDGDDPDSFAQHHSASEVEAYIADNETDFIRFKMRILLKDAGDDPIKRSQVITSILRSIAAIPDPITRSVYLQECSRQLNIDEKVLALQLTVEIGKLLEKASKPSYSAPEEQAAPQQPQPPVPSDNPEARPAAQPMAWTAEEMRRLRPHELTLTKYIVRYGLMPLAQEVSDNESGAETAVTVIDFIASELERDELEFTDPVCRKIYQEAKSIAQNEWPASMQEHQAAVANRIEEMRRKGEDEIRAKASSMTEIQSMEMALQQQCDADYAKAMRSFAAQFLEINFLSAPDDEVRLLATALASEKYVLSKVHSKYAHVDTELDRLQELTTRGILELKFAWLDTRITALNKELKSSPDPARVDGMMKELFELYQLKSQFAKVLGDRIVNPK